VSLNTILAAIIKLLVRSAFRAALHLATRRQEGKQ
jgi:hypothetical protein